MAGHSFGFLFIFQEYWCRFFYFADDYNRVVLEPIEGESDSDYVNASYVDVSNNHFNNVYIQK